MPKLDGVYLTNMERSFKNKGLIKRYNEITLWDKLYHLDALKEW